MWQADKGEFGPLRLIGDHKRGVERSFRAFCVQLRKHLIQALADRATCCHRCHNELRMLRQQSQQFQASIACHIDDRNGNHTIHLVTYSDNKKTLVPPYCTRDESNIFLLPWYHPVCLYQSPKRSYSIANDPLPYCAVAKVERPLLAALFSRGSQPPVLLAHYKTKTSLFVWSSFLRSAAHEGVLRGSHHSELSPDAGSLSGPDLILGSINAGRFLSYCRFKA